MTLSCRTSRPLASTAVGIRCGHFAHLCEKKAVSCLAQPFLARLLNITMHIGLDKSGFKTSENDLRGIGIFVDHSFPGLVFRDDR